MAGTLLGLTHSEGILKYASPDWLGRILGRDEESLMPNVLTGAGVGGGIGLGAAGTAKGLQKLTENKITGIGKSLSDIALDQKALERAYRNPVMLAREEMLKNVKNPEAKSMFKGLMGSFISENQRYADEVTRLKDLRTDLRSKVPTYGRVSSKLLTKGAPILSGLGALIGLGMSGRE